MLKETMDTNSSNENYAERFAVSIIEEQTQSNTDELKEIKIFRQLFI